MNSPDTIFYDRAVDAINETNAHVFVTNYNYGNGTC